MRYRSLIIAAALLCSTVAHAETVPSVGSTDCPAGFSSVYTGFANSEVQAAVVTCSGMGQCDVKPGGVSIRGCAPSSQADYAPSAAIPCALCKRD